MAGFLARYIHRDIYRDIYRGGFEETAYHEASHALRVHSYGIEVGAICLGYNGWTSHVKPVGDPNDHLPSTHAQISLAGPAASLRYLREHPDLVIFFDHSMSFGEQEDEDDLLRVIDRASWRIDNGNRWLKYPDLTPDNFPYCELVGLELDDFERAFHDLLIAFHRRYYRIPRKTTLLRHYRDQERMARKWVNDNWETIGLLALHLLDHGKSNSRYTHRLSGKEFYSWTRKKMPKIAA